MYRCATIYRADVPKFIISTNDFSMEGYSGRGDVELIQAAVKSAVQAAVDSAVKGVAK
jgi:hypothetical protein